MKQLLSLSVNYFQLRADLPDFDCPEFEDNLRSHFSELLPLALLQIDSDTNLLVTLARQLANLEQKSQLRQVLQKARQTQLEPFAQLSLVKSMQMAGVYQEDLVRQLSL